MSYYTSLTLSVRDCKIPVGAATASAVIVARRIGRKRIFGNWCAVGIIDIRSRVAIFEFQGSREVKDKGYK